MIRDPAWWAVFTTAGGIGIRATMTLTRLGDSVRELNASVKEVIEHVANHESRITKLETKLGR